MKRRNEGLIFKVLDTMSDVEDALKLKVKVQTDQIAFLKEAGLTDEEEYATNKRLFKHIVE